MRLDDGLDAAIRHLNVTLFCRIVVYFNLAAGKWRRRDVGLRRILRVRVLGLRVVPVLVVLAGRLGRDAARADEVPDEEACYSEHQRRDDDGDGQLLGRTAADAAHRRSELGF